jgi:AcrR family transcriptional regulator
MVNQRAQILVRIPCMTSKGPSGIVPRVRRSAAGRARHHNSQETVDRILEAAHRVLVKFGYERFTTRRVAQTASVAPGNLSYHFPSKRKLVRALIAKLTADLLAQYASFLANPEVPAGQEVAAGVRWAFDYTISPEGVRLFRELWAMALRDAYIRRAMDDFYDKLREGTVRLVQRAQPGSDVTQIREFVQVLTLISEGASVVYGTRKTSPVPYERIIEIAIDLQKLLAPGLSGTATH